MYKVKGGDPAMMPKEGDEPEKELAAAAHDLAQAVRGAK
jgi:hypothetical protein